VQSAEAASAPRLAGGAWQSPWLLGLLGSLFYWAALPPLDLWPMAWIALVPLVLLARQQTLPGRRPYLALWCSGCAFWLATLYWLTLPHPATTLGWLALSLYLAFYWPVFVGLLRVAALRLGWSVVVAAPVIWAGLELARGHLMTGF
jgi:apolipoprotein N-acyltransferase